MRDMGVPAENRLNNVDGFEIFPHVPAEKVKFVTWGCPHSNRFHQKNNQRNQEELAINLRS